MTLSDFVVGGDFVMSGSRWRCTDIGRRVVVAIRLDDRHDQSWFRGPPYAVEEVVISEDDQKACRRERR